MNMHEENLNSWEEFEDQLREFEKKRIELAYADKYLFIFI
jgi:hypothetical protein